MVACIKEGLQFCNNQGYYRRDLEYIEYDRNRSTQKYTRSWSYKSALLCFELNSVLITKAWCMPAWLKGAYINPPGGSKLTQELMLF